MYVVLRFLLLVYMVYRYWVKLKDLNEVKDFFGLILILE